MGKNGFIGMALLCLAFAFNAHGEEKAFRAVPDNDGVQRLMCWGELFLHSQTYCGKG